MLRSPWTEPGVCQFEEYEGSPACGLPTFRQSIFCPKHIFDLWPASRVSDDKYFIGWKGLNPDKSRGKDCYRGSSNAPYQLGQTFITVGISNFLLSPLGVTKEGYGSYDGAFLLRFSDCRLRADKVIDSQSPAHLLWVGPRRYEKAQAGCWLDNPGQNFEMIQGIEADYRLALPSVHGLILPSDQEADRLLGYRYAELKDPIHPFYLSPKPVEPYLPTLKQLAAVWAAVGDAVRYAFGYVVGDAVGAAVGAAVWAAVGAAVGDAVGYAVGAAVWDAVGDAAGDAVKAYTGWHFPASYPVLKQRYPEAAQLMSEPYLFQPWVRLWQAGLVPVKISGRWQLLASKGDGTCRLAWEGAL